MASGITQIRGITELFFNRILFGIQKFGGITAPGMFTPPPPTDGAILLEDGDFLLLENDFYLLQE